MTLNQFLNQMEFELKRGLSCLAALESLARLAGITFDPRIQAGILGACIAYAAPGSSAAIAAVLNAIEGFLVTGGGFGLVLGAPPFQVFTPQGVGMACNTTHAGGKVQGAGLCCAAVQSGLLTPPPHGTILPQYTPGSSFTLPAGRITTVTDAAGHCASCMIVGSSSRKHPGKPVLKFIRGGPSCPTAGTGCCAMAV